jgi:rare lipoprotein A
MTRKRFAYALAAAFAASASGCATLPTQVQAASCKVRTTGVASWYGPGLYGNKTANGEIFRRGATGTAAHKTLPFNSKVQVTDLETGKKIVVRINDRGPFIAGRVIDLSPGSAQQLGLVNGRGTTDVKLDVLRCGA